MKKKNFISFVLMFCLIFPALFLFTACGDEKNTVSAPVLTEVYQNVDGVVFVKHNGLHNNNYSPEFSLDGINWNNTSKINNNVVSILNYNTTTDKFEYSRGSENFEVDDSTIVIRLREAENRDTKATSSSNTFTYTLKKPQQQPSIEFLNGQKLSDTQVLDENIANTTTYYIVQNNANPNKYTFAQLEKREYIYGNNYNFTLVSSLTASKLEYCFLGEEYRTSIDYEQLEIDAWNDIDTLTFSDCTTDFSIADEYFGNSNSFGETKSALMLVRYKSTSTHLKSRCLVVEIAQLGE